MKVLDDIGMCVAYKGYYYWKEAIKIVMKMKDEDEINMTEIYKKIAEKYNKKETIISVNMARVLERIKDLNKKLNVEYKLTTKKVLILLVKKEKGE